MKSSYYFDHDYNARNDQKILMLRAEYGWAGYGLFFALCEYLCESKGYIKRVALAGLSVGFNYPLTELSQFVDNCIKIGLLHESEEGLYNDRIIDHLQYREKLSNAGRLGGRGNKRDDKAIVKPPFNDLKATLEAEEERKEKERKEKERKRDIQMYVSELNFYNDNRGKNMTACVKMTDDRKAHLKKRIAEYGIEKWHEAILKCAASDFCNGRVKGGNGWVANIDFILQPSSFQKIIEGFYDNKDIPAAKKETATVGGMGDSGDQDVEEYKRNIGMV